jgi:hypothetical protein
MQFVGLVKQTTSGAWLSTEIPTTLAMRTTEIDSDIGEDADGSLGVLALAPEVPTIPPPPAIPVAAGEPERPKAIFVGHGVDKTAVTQLTKILDEVGLPYKVAEYEPNATTVSCATSTATRFGCRRTTWRANWARPRCSTTAASSCSRNRASTSPATTRHRLHRVREGQAVGARHGSLPGDPSLRPDQDQRRRVGATLSP